MKNLLPFLLILGSFAASASDQPTDRVCRSYGAQSETVVVDGQNSPIVLCNFGLFSYIEKETLRNSHGGYGTSAVREYVSSANNPFGQHCVSAGASIISAQTVGGRLMSLCEFFDGSIMEEQTFSNGPRSSFNQEMNFALGLH